MNDKACITVGVRLAERLCREARTQEERFEVSKAQLAIMLAMGIREGWLRRQEALDRKPGQKHVPGRLLVTEAPPENAPPCALMELFRAALHGSDMGAATVEAHGQMVELTCAEHADRHGDGQ